MMKSQDDGLELTYRHVLEDLDNLPSPEVIAREIVDDLTAALAEFEAVASALELAAAPETVEEIG